MYIHCNPKPGHWYASSDGRLIQVRAKMYVGGELNSITIEDIESKRTHISTIKWIEMSPVLHSSVSQTA